MIVLRDLINTAEDADLLPCKLYENGRLEYDEKLAFAPERLKQHIVDSWFFRYGIIVVNLF